MPDGFAHMVIIPLFHELTISWFGEIWKPHYLADKVEGYQTMPPPNLPIWNMDYFELKAFENQHMQAKS